jgi:hypothetical protein
MKKKILEPKVPGDVRGKCGGIGDAVSQTIGAKNTNGTQCSTVTLQLTFQCRIVAISGGRTNKNPLWGLNVTWSEHFGSYPSEV